MAKARKMNRGISGATKNHPDSSPKLVQISNGHVFKDFLQLEAFCGIRLSGWKYGNPSSVECSTCRELYEVFAMEKEAAAKKR